MTQVLRGPDISYNALNVNSDLYNAIGYFDFVLPGDWDNTSSADKLLVDITGGVTAVGGPAPTAFQVFFQYSLQVIDGGSTITAPLSVSGDSYTIGSVTRSYYGDPPGGAWTTVGPQTFDGGEFDPTANADVASTLVDGVTWGYSGEGFYLDPPNGDGPVGYRPSLNNGRSSDGTPTNVKTTPGQTVTVFFYMFNESTDNVNPDRSIYAFVSALTLRYKGTSYPIDLTMVWVGWSAGNSFVYFRNHPQFTVYPNPGRFVESTPPPIPHPDEQIFTDFYLEAGPRRRVSVRGVRI